MARHCGLPLRREEIVTTCSVRRFRSLLSFLLYQINTENIWKKIKPHNQSQFRGSNIQSQSFTCAPIYNLIKTSSPGVVYAYVSNNQLQ